MEIKEIEQKEETKMNQEEKLKDKNGKGLSIERQHDSNLKG